MQQSSGMSNQAPQVGSRWRHKRTKRIALVADVTSDRVLYGYAERVPGARQTNHRSVPTENFLRAFAALHDYVVYAEGICFMSVCSSLPAAELEDRLRAERPAGTTRNWELSKEPFATGQSNPCSCNSHPETRKHFLFVC